MSPPIRLLCLALVAPLAAQDPPQRPRDLTEVALEELLNIEVTSVSKKQQKLSSAASAVYALTSEEIRRSGFTSIPEALRMVPGLQVARIDSNKWAISSRGFNGQYANKLLVLIDGRSVYTPLFSGVYWDLQDILIEDVDRIEVIRGPGATMWGANAVNGVINIITKRAKDTQGGLLALGGGNEDLASGAFRYGARAGSTAHYRIYTRYFNRNELLDAAGGGAGDGWNVLRGGFRLDWDKTNRDSLTFQGDLFRADNHQRVDVPLLRRPFSQTVSDDLDATGGYLMGRWTRSFSPRSDTALQVYYDRYNRHDLFIGEGRSTLDFDFQHHYTASERQDLLWGLGQRFSRDQTRATPYASLVPDQGHLNLFNAFVQDEIALVSDRLYLIAGAKLEHNTFTGVELQPGVKLAWSPNERHTAWASVSRAVRTPSRGERDGRLNMAARPGPNNLPLLVLFIGNPGLQSEKLNAYELGYRVQPARRFSLDVAAFFNQYRHMMINVPGAPRLVPGPSPYLTLPTGLQNGARGESYGAELAAHWTVTRRWKVAAAYTGLRIFMHFSDLGATVQDREGASPQHQAQLRSNFDLTRTLQWDTAFYYVGRLRATGIPDYTRLDTRLGWRPTEVLEISLGLQNLLDARHPEYVAEALTHPSLVRRAAYGRILWRF